jgi:hypothetical protein
MTVYDHAGGFYEGKLGFEFVPCDPYALLMRVGGHLVRVSKIPNFLPQQGTILGWQVEDIAAAAIWLKEKGVTVEKSFHPRSRTGDLDSTERRQSGVVQRSGREYSFLDRVSFRRVRSPRPSKINSCNRP